MKTTLRNLKLIVAYDGTDYCGWQRQAVSREAKGKKSIQGTLEKTLERILQEKVDLTAAGRTDSGVHAEGQVANFKTSSKLKPGIIKKALNGLLPPDISVADVRYVPLEFHATHGAKSKLYRYTVLNRSFPSPLLRRYVYFIPYPLDAGMMKKEAKALLGRHDFKSFQAADKRPRSSVRTIKKIDVRKRKDLITIDIEADGFLYNMVRNIVGTLLQAGRGKSVPGAMRKILQGRDRSLAGPTAPARGLCLMKVKY